MPRGHRLRRFALIATLTGAMHAAGCATVFDWNDRTRISVDSNPPGAVVRVNGENRGTTPVDLILSDTETYEITATYQGETRSAQVSPQIGVVWVVLDVLFGIVPVVVDAITEKWCDLSPRTLNFTFGEVDAP